MTLNIIIWGKHTSGWGNAGADLRMGCPFMGQYLNNTEETMENLYKETLEYMTLFGKKKEDVDEVQWYTVLEKNQQSFRCDFETFKRASLGISYDNGFGSQEINRSLIVLFKDGSWMERWEHNGAEGWKFISPLGSKNWLPLTTDIEQIRKSIHQAGTKL